MIPDNATHPDGQFSHFRSRLAVPGLRAIHQLVQLLTHTSGDGRVARSCLRLFQA